MSNSVFRDLEIDVSIMTTDPRTFSNNVYAVADQLCEVLTSDPSTKAGKNLITKAAQRDKEAKGIAEEELSEAVAELYRCSEEDDLNVVYHKIQVMKQLVHDMELSYDARARNTAILTTATISDKRLASEQYKRLREAFEKYRNFINVISDDPIVLSPLKAKSGNFGGPDKQAYPAYMVNGELYHNCRVVGKMVGMETPPKSHADLQEYLVDTHNTEVEIIEFSL